MESNTEHALIPLSFIQNSEIAFDDLPEALLFLIATKLDCHRDLCNLEAVNKFCR